MENTAKKISLTRRKQGIAEKAFLGWYTASSRYRARGAKNREAIERATTNKTLWRQKRQRARNHIKGMRRQVLI
jgi:hypothetical protein